MCVCAFPTLQLWAVLRCGCRVKQCSVRFLRVYVAVATHALCLCGIWLPPPLCDLSRHLWHYGASVASCSLQGGHCKLQTTSNVLLLCNVYAGFHLAAACLCQELLVLACHPAHQPGCLPARLHARPAAGGGTGPSYKHKKRVKQSGSSPVGRLWHRDGSAGGNRQPSNSARYWRHCRAPPHSEAGEGLSRQESDAATHHPEVCGAAAVAAAAAPTQQFRP